MDAAGPSHFTVVTRIYDVDASGQDDVHGRIALTLYEDDVAGLERQGLGALRKPLDLGLRQAREQRRIVRTQEALGPRW